MALIDMITLTVTALSLIADAQVTRPLAMFGDLVEFRVTDNHRFTSVNHIEEDRAKPGSFIVADGNALLYLLPSGNVSIIAGEPNESGYNEGSGTNAHFQQITSFSQYSDSEIAVVDMNNHCIRKVIRENQQTSTFVGQCTQQGSVNGTGIQPLAAKLRTPVAIVFHEKKRLFFIGLAEDGTTGSIIKYDVDASLVSLVTKAINSFSFMIFDNAMNNLIVTRSGGVLKVDTSHGNVSLISGSLTETLKSDEDISDGSLLGAKFKYLSELAWLIPDQVLVVGDSKALRIVNLVDDKVESLCKSSKSSVATIFGANGTCGIQTLYTLTMMNGTLYFATEERQSFNKVYRILQIQVTVPKCELPPDVENGDFSPRLHSYRHLDEIQFTCQPPYAVVGPHSLSCSRTSQWSDTSPKCSSFNVKRVSPSNGQASGGTKVTAEGDFPSDVQVKLSSQSGNGTRLEFNRASNGIKFVMPPGYENSTVVIMIGSLSGYVSNHSYNYTPNPILTSNRTTASIVSGGTTFRAQGMGLSSAREYKLQLSYKGGKSIELICESTKDMLSVTMPNLKQHWFSDAQLNGSEELVANISARLFGDEVPVHGADNFSMLIFQDPKLYNMTEPFHVSQSKPLVLTGSMLNLAAKKDDYNITIGDIGQCSDVIVYKDRLECSPPYSSSVELDFQHSIRVKVGNLEFQPGALLYNQQPAITPGSIAVPTVVPIVVILIVVAVVVGIVVYRRRQSQVRQTFEPVSLEVRSISHTATPEGGLEMIINVDLRVKVDEMRIDPADVVISYNTSPIGKGNFGCIYIGQLKLAGGQVLKTVAVKTLKDTQDIDIDMVENFLQEATLLTGFRHVNILTTIGIVWLKGDRPKVVMPYMSRGDLGSLVRKPELKLTNGDLLHFCMQIAAGMEYLSDHKFVHRDLAARNCLVDDEFLVKIADFGMSRDVYDKDYYREGDRSKPKPIKWMAIESIKQGVYNSSTDVWAFGVTMWELCTRGSTPYPGIGNKELLDYLESGRRLNQPTYTHPVIYELMVRCWYTDSLNRPSFQGIHTFLKKCLDENPLSQEELDQPEYSYVQSRTKHIPGDYESSQDDGYKFSQDRKDPNSSEYGMTANHTASDYLDMNDSTSNHPRHGLESLISGDTNTDKPKPNDYVTQRVTKTNSDGYENIPKSEGKRNDALTDLKSPISGLEKQYLTFIS